MYRTAHDNNMFLCTGVSCRQDLLTGVLLMLLLYVPFVPLPTPYTMNGMFSNSYLHTRTTYSYVPHLLRRRTYLRLRTYYLGIMYYFL